jgi:segregation and condensation protein B
MGAEGDLRTDQGAADVSEVEGTTEERDVVADETPARRPIAAVPDALAAPLEADGDDGLDAPARPRPDLARTIESLLFLSPQPVTVADLAEATEATEGQVAEAIELLSEDLADGRRGIVLRLIGGGFALASDPASEESARRLLAKPRTPPLTQAQAETLAIVAYLQPVSRPEVARIRGVTSESAVQTLAERGLIEESGRSRFGAAIFKTSDLFERLFGLDGLDALPDPSRFDPSPEDERELRERLLKAGEQRAE